MFFLAFSSKPFQNFNLFSSYWNQIETFAIFFRPINNVFEKMMGINVLQDAQVASYIDFSS